MNEDRAQVIEQLKQANNVLVTVNNDPTVDQLAACLGITILLNKLGKHATAVFSGKTPSTIEFLKPEDTFEKNTNSLRDFIISLDKTKADKLRYKVEDTMVKIFITPYRTSVSEKDLEFSQGDFNVDVVLALGIHERTQVDAVIMDHGRILHDAVVVSVDNKEGESIGTFNWIEAQASSLSEMITSIVEELDTKGLDEQISTALLTGIVAETERFRNDKTTSITMSMSSKLMAAGANQQLIATELEPQPIPQMSEDQELPEFQDEQGDDEGGPQDGSEDKSMKPEDGEIKIAHTDLVSSDEGGQDQEQEIDPNEIHIDDYGELRRAADITKLEKEQNEKEEAGTQSSEDAEGGPKKDSRLVFQPPTLGGTLTANSQPEQLDPTTDPMSKSEEDQQPLLERKNYIDNQTLDKIEQVVKEKTSDETTKEEVEPVETIDKLQAKSTDESASYPASYFDSKSHKLEPPPPAKPFDPGAYVEADAARDAVNDAINQAEADGTAPPSPLAALGSSPVDLSQPATQEEVPPVQPQPVQDSATQLDTSSLSTPPPAYPPNLVPLAPIGPTENTASGVDSPESPPPVPPPMMPPTGSLNS